MSLRSLIHFYYDRNEKERRRKREGDNFRWSNHMNENMARHPSDNRKMNRYTRDTCFWLVSVVGHFSIGPHSSIGFTCIWFSFVFLLFIIHSTEQNPRRDKFTWKERRIYHKKPNLIHLVSTSNLIRRTDRRLPRWYRWNHSNRWKKKKETSKHSRLCFTGRYRTIRARLPLSMVCMSVEFCKAIYIWFGKR